MRRARGNYNLFRRHAWFVPSAADVFILLALLLGGALLGSLTVLALTKALGPAYAMEYGTLLSYPLMFVPPMLWAAFRSGQASASHKGLSLDSANVRPLGWVACVLMVSLGTLALGVVCDALNTVLPPMPEWLRQMMESLTTGKLWINFLCVSVFAPFFEEWLCRGMVLRGLLGRGMKPVWAIVLSALFFAIIHMNPWQAVPAFLLGLLFGYVYYRTGSLKLTMLMHFVNNTAALTLGHIEALRDSETWMDVLGPSYWSCFAACLLLTALVTMAFRRIPLQRPSGNCNVVPPLFGEE